MPAPFSSPGRKRATRRTNPEGIVDAKEATMAAIADAQADLEEALTRLEHLPAFDPGTVGFAAHALSNYIAVIDGTIYLLREALQDHENEKIMRWLVGLQHANQLMTHTVNQLMNTSNNDVAVFKSGEVDLPVLVERACDYYRRIAARKQIRVEFKSRAGLPSAWVDRVPLAAALDNLLSNAVKYSPPGRTVHVEVRSEAGSLVCGVRDEGPGLGAEDRAKLFQKGVRLSATPTGGEPSTGYGLAVAQDLVKHIGGEIWCESRLGEGAAFFIRVPAAPKAAPCRTASRESPH